MPVKNLQWGSTMPIKGNRISSVPQSEVETDGVCMDAMLCQLRFYQEQLMEKSLTLVFVNRYAQRLCLRDVPSKAKVFWHDAVASGFRCT